MEHDNKNNVELYQSDETHKNVDRLDSATHITEGMFAQFLETPDQSGSNSYSELVKGDILLITKLDYANGELHSVTVKDHPRNANKENETKSFTFLLDVFYKSFDFLTQEQGQAIRDKELAALNGRIEQKKQEYSDLEKNPEKLNAISLSIYSKRLASPQSPVFSGGVNNVVDLLGSPNASEQIEQYSASMGMAQDLIQIQLNYLQDITKDIIALSQKVMPYVIERMVVNMSSMEEKKAEFEKMNDSMASMQLYNGVSVEVMTIRKGESADPSIPLTLMQERLFADIELSYFKAQQAESLDILEFNDSFLSELVSNDLLVDQIFPTQRCVCVMAIREQDIDYKDTLYSLRMNEANKQSFLLIRDGENIHAVYSPIGSHLAAKNLFPSKSALDRHFFSSEGDIVISPDSLDYVKATSDADREVLHYKRFLILIAGLQHRLNLFGRFYPEKEVFKIFNIGFQKKYFNYIHDADGEGLLTDGNTTSLRDWALLKNKRLHKGSMVICDNHAMTIYQTAAACFRWSMNNRSSDNDGYSRIKGPVERFTVAECQMNKDGEFFVKVKCSNAQYIYDYDKKPHEVDAVYLLAEGSSSFGYYDSKIPYLVLDSLSVEELEYYCSQRRYRKEYMQYMHLFKSAIAYLKEAEANNSNDVEYYLKAVSHIQDTAHKPYEVRSMINDAIFFFKRKNSRDTILTYLYSQLSSKGAAKLNIDSCVKKAARYLEHDGIHPIALMQNNKGEYIVYTNILAHEELNQIEPHIWMNRYALVNKRNVFSLELIDEKVSFDKHHREERLITVFNQDVYDWYYSNTSWSCMSINYNGGVKKTFTKMFNAYDIKLQMVNLATYSVGLLRKIVSNTVDRSTVEFLHGLIEKRSSNYYEQPINLLGLYIGFKKGHPIVKLYIANGEKWITALYEKYQEHPDLDLVEQDNSELNYYVDSVNMVNDWTIERNIFSIDSRVGYREESLPKYSSRSIGYAIRDFIENMSERDAIVYSPFQDYLDSMFAVDEFLGNKNIVKPVITLGALKAHYSVSKKPGYTLLDQCNPAIIAEVGKLDGLDNLLREKLEEKRAKWNLQTHRVDISTHRPTRIVIHPEDYKYIANSRSFGYQDNDWVWLKEHECYVNNEALELLSQPTNTGNKN